MRWILPALALVAACAQRPPDGATAPPAATAPTAPAATPGDTEDGPVPCPLPASAPPGDLLRAAASARDAGRPAVALSCSDAALAGDAGNGAALRERALSLAELGREEEAREAVGRVLARDPDDPASLLLAAELHVTRFRGRDALEAGRALALRGAARVRSGPRADPSRLARLLLVAGMAENDLGRNGEALAHLDESLARDPRDLDAQYERAVALWELCRFPQARRAFERVLRRSPRDAWTLHHLGLLAERAGEERRAADLLSRASRLAPGDLPPAVAVSREAFEAELRRAIAALPESERAALAGVPVEVEEVPDLADLAAVDPPLSPGILGLFRGPPLGEPCPAGEGPSCRSIALFRRNLLRFARDRAGLDEQVRTTLLHEIGHLHGESDEELRARGLE